jgi:hypothetical protein
MDSSAAASCSNGRDGSGVGNGDNLNTKSSLIGAAVSNVISPGTSPSRSAASCAFVFQSARRKRSAAAEYHFAASAFCPEVSKYFASSNATIASRVFS